MKNRTQRRSGCRLAVIVVSLAGAVLPAAVMRGDDKADQPKPAVTRRSTAKVPTKTATKTKPAPAAALAKPATKTHKTAAAKKTGGQKSQPTVKKTASKTDKKKKTGKTKTGKTRTAPNPLADLIRRMLPKPGANRPVAGGVKKSDKKDEGGPANGFRSARDDIDGRAPHDPDQANLLRMATIRIRDKNWKEALVLLQRLLDPPRPTAGSRAVEDSLIRRPDGHWISVRDEARRLLGTLPKEARDNYRMQYDPTAKRLLTEARRDGNIARLVEVATKFFHTEAGFQAADLLGNLHFDRGEFGIAARWYRQLIEASAPMTNDDRWRLKAAVAFRQSGDTPAADRLLHKLSSSGGPHRVELAGRPVDPGKWLARLGTAFRDRLPRLDDWPMFFGTPARTGTAIGGTPLLLRRWTQSTTSSRPILDQIRTLTEDLTDAGTAPISVFFPLTVDNKVIFRTLRGVMVADARTGRPLWETEEGISPERLLSAQPRSGSRSYRTAMWRGAVFAGAVNPFVRSQMSYVGTNADQHPLTSLLYRNGLYGIINSDSRQLFVIERQALLSRAMPGRNWGSDPNSNDSFRRDWSTNRVVAYDLETGRINWEIGGTRMGEPFDLPLAGTYFFGAPVADGGDLFVVGEADKEIRLYVLDAASGLPKWSQLIAVSDSSIAKDFGRRWWTAQVSVKDGVIVCPTTVGWMVGIDRVRHSVLWAHRYTKPAHTSHSTRGGRVFGFGRGRTVPLVQAGRLNSRWLPSAPVVVDNRLIYTPSEHTAVICLNASTGRSLWEIPKGTALYLAGVFDRRVVLVGKDTVTALSLKDGTTRWQTKIPAADGKPSGVGVASGHYYYVPLSSGQLWTIDLASGKIVSRSYLFDDERPLGNLALYRGTFLSLTPRAMTAFEQREAVEAEIRDRKARNPHDPQALLQEANIHRLGHRYSLALTSLRSIRAGDVPAHLVARYRRTMIGALTAVVRSDFNAHDAENAELAAFVKSTDEQLRYQRLLAERLDARKQYRQAFNLYWKLAHQTNGDTLVRGDDTKITLTMNRWLAGKLSDLWSRLPQKDRDDVNTRIKAAARSVLTADVAAQERFLTLFGFHPAALDVQWKLIDSYATARKLVAAERRLLRLSRGPQPETAARAVERLARLLRTLGLKRDADYYYAILATRFKNVKLPGSETGGQLVNRLRSAGKIGGAVTYPPLSWGDVDLKVVSIGASSSYSSGTAFQLSLDNGQLPFYRDHRIEFFIRTGRLGLYNVRDESQYWIVPLRRAMRLSQAKTASASANGHQLFVSHSGVLHCLSPALRKVLWTRTLDVRGTGRRTYSAVRTSNTTLQTGTGILASGSLEKRMSRGGLVAVSNEDYVCLYGRRKFTVLDTATGAVLWTREKVRPTTRVFGTNDVLFVIPQDRSKAVALRASDGKPLDIPHVAALIARTVRVTPGGLVLVEAGSAGGILGLFRGKTVIRLYDPLTKQDRWKHRFAGSSSLAMLGDGQVVAMTSAGTVSLVDLTDGRLETFADEFTADDLKMKRSVAVLGDRDNLYFLIGKRSRIGRSTYYGSGIATLRVNGRIVAFNRKTGRRLWGRDVKNQNLVRQQFGATPFLVFSTRKYVRSGRNIRYWETKLLAIDKQTGRTLLDSTTPSQNGFYSMIVNIPERYVELRTYNQRVRLSAVARGTSASR